MVEPRLTGDFASAAAPIGPDTPGADVFDRFQRDLLDRIGRRTLLQGMGVAAIGITVTGLGAWTADQIVAAIRKNGGTAWHLVGTNEGHGFAKKENADYNFWTSLLFWKQYLLN